VRGTPASGLRPLKLSGWVAVVQTVNLDIIIQNANVEIVGFAHHSRLEFIGQGFWASLVQATH